MMNKRGQGLSMETIIIAILVLVVLVFVIIFFTGGFSSLSAKIKDTLFGVAAGEDKSIALQNCNSYCERAKEYAGNTELEINSPYCTKWFKIDMNNDGSADKDPAGNYIRFYCDELNNKLQNDDSGAEAATIKGLGITCPQIQCR